MSRPGRGLLRRAAVCVLLGVLLSQGGCQLLVQRLGGASSQAPENLRAGLSPAARELLETALAGIDPQRAMDFHVHVAGLGTGGEGTFVHPGMLSWWHPVRHIQFLLYASASGIDDLERADEQYRARLTSLVDGFPQPGRFLLLAFDQHYSAEGQAVPDRTEFFVPNDLVMGWAAARPDRFVPAASVHPYRPDATQELLRLAKSGVRVVKWLPNAMGIDPASERCAAFYAIMRSHDMILLTHAGVEKAVHAEEDQELGNPLRLRAPLDAGVRVVVAHCASLGESLDLDHADPQPVDSFDLFLRLMAEERYEGLLFGEISALIQANRLPRPLRVLLERADLHARLVNGSDYPLPAINLLIQTRRLVAGGFLNEEERRLLNEIYDYNPLLFDLVAKRTLRHPETGQRFAASVFEVPAGWTLFDPGP